MSLTIYDEIKDLIYTTYTDAGYIVDVGQELNSDDLDGWLDIDDIETTDEPTRTHQRWDILVSIGIYYRTTNQQSWRRYTDHITKKLNKKLFLTENYQVWVEDDLDILMVDSTSTYKNALLIVPIIARGRE